MIIYLTVLVHSIVFYRTVWLSILKTKIWWTFLCCSASRISLLLSQRTSASRPRRICSHYLLFAPREPNLRLDYRSEVYSITRPTCQSVDWWISIPTLVQILRTAHLWREVLKDTSLRASRTSFVWTKYQKSQKVFWPVPLTSHCPNQMPDSPGSCWLVRSCQPADWKATTHQSDKLPIGPTNGQFGVRVWVWVTGGWTNGWSDQCYAPV